MRRDEGFVTTGWVDGKLEALPSLTPHSQQQEAGRRYWVFALGRPAAAARGGCGRGGSFHLGAPVARGGVQGPGGRGAGGGRAWRGGYAGAVRGC